LLIPTIVCATDFSGRVIGVLDGDTLEVLNGHHADRIRLSGIDCPEKSQAFGNNAKYAASALAFGKDVTIQAHGYDKYGRTLEMCTCPMAPTSIMRWSKTASACGIGNIRQGIRCWKG
jgi:endonuclease YncB( thermonuclease family)